ncbi:MAG TPA: hypothetical protein PKA88_27385 [Polyangiaceae bacterium]|nr:hypothetical protein [Polyangiaceae bacterium]
MGIAGIITGLGLVGYALFGGPSEEELIREQLHRFAHVLGVDPSENAVFRLGRLNKEFKTLLTDNVHVRVRELTSLERGRKGLAAVAARAGVYFTGAEISLSDFEIQIDAKETSATVKCLARLTAEQGGQPRRDDRRVDFKLAKVDGDWLIDSIFVSDVNEEQEAEAVPALP